MSNIVNAAEFMILANAKESIPARKKRKNSILLTDQNKEFLHRFQVGYSDMYYNYQALPVVRTLKERLKKGLASPNEMRKLKANGISLVHQRTSKEAQFILNGGNPDDYNQLIITMSYRMYDRDYSITRNSRKDIKKVYQYIKKKGGKDFKFNVIDK